jgi:hypothetical protein
MCFSSSPLPERSASTNHLLLAGSQEEHCISLPSSCISAAAGRELIVHPVSCSQKEKEAHIMKLKLITRPELPEPEVTIASAPKDKEAELIVQALQGIGNTLNG